MLGTIILKVCCCTICLSGRPLLLVIDTNVFIVHTELLLASFICFDEASLRVTLALLASCSAARSLITIEP